ncbi:hypothetical protein ACFQZS_05515, partial [Mucilaginibacter calamicampi]
LKETIRGIKEHLRKIPNKGLGFGVFATEEGSSCSYEALPKVSFNYLGQFDNKENEWQLAGEASGTAMSAANKHPDVININGKVLNSKLSFTIITRLGQEATEHFAARFKADILQVISHCTDKLEQTGRSHTPSDFKGVRISQALLDRLQTKMS